MLDNKQGMQIVSTRQARNVETTSHQRRINVMCPHGNGDILHEMSKPVFWEK